MSFSRRVHLQPAFILHTRIYRNTSLIIDVLSQDYGRLSLVAKGARGEKSKSRGLMQIFTPLLISWVQKGEMGTVTGVELNNNGLLLSGRQMVMGLYMNELVVRFLYHGDASQALYQIYQKTLNSFFLISKLDGKSQCSDEASCNEIGLSEQCILRVFEKQLLEIVGYGLILDREVSNDEPLKSDQVYNYYLEHGPVLVERTDSAQIKRPYSGPAFFSKSSVRCQGSSLIGLYNNKLQDKLALRESKVLLRAVIDNQLVNKKLNSRHLASR